MNNTLLVVVGPTAIGKTNLGIQLAKHCNCDIISADSRQFYKEMCIGTAVPSTEELKEAPHHFIQHIHITDRYSVGDFEKDALQKLDALFKTQNTVIMVGGSGLYVDAVTNGLDDFPEVTENARNKVKLLYKNQGLDGLQQALKKLDPIHYKKVDLMNPHRVMRALHVCFSSGSPYSSFLTEKTRTRPFNVIKIGITADRKIIYDRINQRVDQMIAHGLIEEATNLYPQKSLNALNTVGYKEIFSFIEGNLTRELAIEEIKKNTRRFAKRQLTWFRKDKNIIWFDYTTTADSILEQIKNRYNNLIL